MTMRLTRRSKSKLVCGVNSCCQLLVSPLGDTKSWQQELIEFNLHKVTDHPPTHPGDISWRHHLVSHIGVISWCHHMVSHIGVISWCHNLLSHIGVNSCWYFLVSPPGVTSLCHHCNLNDPFCYTCRVFVMGLTSGESTKYQQITILNVPKLKIVALDLKLCCKYIIMFYTNYLVQNQTCPAL